ncbi:MAG: EAL domain-containing protein [Gammaproteobacteria bacterium]|jgi:diguanylate cyclase (GGDEF)-like protein/PAS domain S-box-containing protein
MSSSEYLQANVDTEGTDLDEPVILDVNVFEPELENQKVELVYTQATAALLTAFIVAVLVALGLWGVADHTQLAIWLGAQSILTVARLALVFQYRHAPKEQLASSRWLGLFLTGALLSGIVWGCLGLLFSYSWPVEYQTLTLMSLAGVLAGAISSNAAVLSVYIAFMVPAILIPAQSMLMHNSSISHNMGLLLMLFAGGLLVIARNYNKNVIQSLQLRDENNVLLRETAEINVALQAEAGNRHQIQKQLLRERQLFTKGSVTVFRCTAEQGWPIEYISETISQYGYDSKRLVEEKALYASIVHASDVQRITESELQSGQDGTHYIGIDYRIVCSNGDVRWVYSYSIPVKDDAGELTHYAGYILDITSRKQAEFDLEQARERAQVTLHSIADAVITTDVNGQVEYLNPRAEQLSGWESRIARGLPLSRILCLFEEESQSLLEAPVTQCLRHGEIIQSGCDISLQRHDGECFSVQYSASPILFESGSALGVILVIHDVTEARQMQQKISYQATHDALTGLINRTEFENRLTYSIESAVHADESHVLCYVDIDQLKIINDTCSHESGDALIREITGLIHGCLRESDVLARLGGDEFGVLLKNCSLDSAVDLVESMLTVIHELPFSGCNRVFDVTASIGMAAIDSGTRSATEVMIEADLACHEAKDAGGDRLHIYHRADQGLARRHSEMQWVSRVKEAIKSDRLVLYCQAIVPVITDINAGHHFEVLVRMIDDNGDIITPDNFLPAAERYNLMTSLDRWVVSHSFSWYAGHRMNAGISGLDTIAINLSGASVSDTGFMDHIKAEMQNHEVPAGLVCFEITETAAIANLEAATGFIRELKRLGCRFSLDDFGSGLSSFTYLKNLPVDYLKIDGSFVRDMETDAIDCAMVSSIHQLAGVIGIKTIAEFVENDGILDKLAEIGIDYAQGYGISRPVPLLEVDVASMRSA